MISYRDKRVKQKSHVVRDEENFKSIQESMRKIENKKHESEKIKAKTNKIYCNKGINMKGITLSVVTSSSTREITRCGNVHTGCIL